MHACLVKPEYFYWEVLECLRKLLLTGVAVAIIPGSLIQSVVSLGVIVVYAVAVAQFKPYRTARDNTLALILYSMLAVTLFIGLLLKVLDGYENSGKYEDGFTATAMTGVLVSTIVAVLVAGIGAVVYDTRRVLREPLLQYKEGRGIVTLPPLGGASFDLFLSHAQDLGQDQVATIKGMLEKLLPSIKIFLDVESLDDLHALDKLIIGSKAVLIFLTTGCLQRYFVRLEISAAANNGIKTILVQETDDRHGCTPVKQHRGDCPDDAREAVFDSGREAVLWIRAAHYKLVSIKQIVQRMIVSDSDALPKLVLPGEISLCEVALTPVETKSACHFWLPDCAPWCSRLEACLRKALPNLSVRRAATGSFASTYDQSTQTACSLLVPLNARTLEDEGVQQDLRAALQAKTQLVLLHIQEEEFGAASFGRFFEQCPDHLRGAGLFDELACAWFFNEPHLSISCKVVGMKLNTNKLPPLYSNSGAKSWQPTLWKFFSVCKKTSPIHAVVPVDAEALGGVKASSCVSVVTPVDEEAVLGESNTPSHVSAALVDDRSVDATLDDEALKEVNTSKADAEQMPVQAMEVPMAVVGISDSIKGGDEPSDDEL